MDKDRIREFLIYWQEFRSELYGDLEDYQSGQFFTGKIDAGKRIDTTERTISDIKARLANIDRVIAAYKANLGA